MRRIADGRRGPGMPMTADMDDVIEVAAHERRDDVRVIVNLPGRYMLASKRNLKGERCEFPCRIVNISLAGMALSAPVPGPVGERVIVYSEQFGRLHGAITRVMTTGFVMSIAANPQTREKLAAKLDWLDKQKDSPELPDSRRHARVVPKNPMATILLADGSTTSCLVIDFSDSGAAVSAALYPKPRAPPRRRQEGRARGAPLRRGVHHRVHGKDSPRRDRASAGARQPLRGACREAIARLVSRFRSSPFGFAALVKISSAAGGDYLRADRKTAFI